MMMACSTSLFAKGPWAGDVDMSFNPGTPLNNAVNDMAVQPDGKILIAGEFSQIRNKTVGGRIMRLNPDGSTDQTFLNGLAGADFTILTMVLQTNGQILIGGYFSQVNGVNHRSLARLNSNGSLDTTFLNGLAGPKGSVYAVAVQSDGKVLIGGQFTSVNGLNRTNLARLNIDGTVDTNFLNGLSGANDLVYSIAIQTNGMAVIGGAFTNINGVLRNRIARLNVDGTVDLTFLNGGSGADGDVSSIALQSDGKILIGGGFGSVNTEFQRFIGRLNPNGTTDTNFLKGMTGAYPNPVNKVLVQTNGQILIGGWFDNVNGMLQNRIARLNSDGSLDNGFMTFPNGVDYEVIALAIQNDGKILIGGRFWSVNGLDRKYIARVNNADGTLDSTFNANFDGITAPVNVAVAQSDGKVLIGGSFTNINRSLHNRIARLNADGALDASFMNGLSGANEQVFAVTVQADGKILIGGAFTSVNGTNRNRIARLNTDGTLDAGFLNGMNGSGSPVRSIALQANGEILIGGDFSSINGKTRVGIARLNIDGSLDTNFIASANAAVRSVIVQPDGQILIGGDFSTVNSTPQNRIARLNDDGTLDFSFMDGLSGMTGQVRSMALHADGRVVVGGFWDGSPSGHTNLVQLNSDGSIDSTFIGTLYWSDEFVNAVATQPDDKVLVGGVFTTINGDSCLNATRLNSDGTKDTNFYLGGSYSLPVNSIQVLADGKILVGGAFDYLGSSASTIPIQGVARIWGSTPVIIDSTSLVRTNNQFRFISYGEPSRICEIWAGPDPSQLTFLQQVTNSLSGTSVFIESGVTDPRRFYQVRELR